MADASRAAFSSIDAALSLCWGRRTSHDRNSLYLSTDPQSAPGDCTALVVPQPVSRFARKTALPGMPRLLKPAFQQAISCELIPPRNQTGFAELGHAHPRPEIIQ
jgi:hypothetical protein